MTIKETIIWMIRTTRGLRLPITLSVIAGVLSVLLSILFVWSSKSLVDIATGSVEGELNNYIYIIVGSMFMQLVLFNLSARLDSVNSVRLSNRLRENIFNKIMIKVADDNRDLHSGNIINRLIEDVRLVADSLTIQLPKIFVSVAQLIAAFVFLLTLEPILALCIVLIMPMALLLSSYFVKRMRTLSSNIREADGELHSFMQENLQHSVMIRSLEYTPTMSNNLRGKFFDIMKLNVKRINFTFSINSLVQAGFITGYLTAFIWGVTGIHSGALTFGMMTAFLQLVSQIQRPIAEMGSKIQAVTKSLASVDRLDQISAVETENIGEPVALSGEVSVIFDNVTFAYNDAGRKVLDNFSFNFEACSRTALVGETGAGKSTMIKLMLALIKPQSGRVVLTNGETTIEVSPSTRCNFVYVPQGNSLMSGTIRENLLMGNPNATDSELAKVLKSAIAEFVYDLPNGIDTMCGEKGVGLSEGQAQRIAIARGLLRSGAVILLDEPTSALDSDTEKELLISLSNQQRTIIMVTHRSVEGYNICRLSSK